MADDASRIASDRVAQIVIVICRVADGHVVVHLLYVIGNVDVVLVLAARAAVLLYVYVLRQVQFVLHELISEVEAGALAHKLIHVCSLDDFLAALPVDGLLVILITVVHLSHKSTIA